MRSFHVMIVSIVISLFPTFAAADCKQDLQDYQKAFDQHDLKSAANLIGYMIDWSKVDRAKLDKLCYETDGSPKVYRIFHDAIAWAVANNSWDFLLLLLDQIVYREPIKYDYAKLLYKAADSGNPEAQYRLSRDLLLGRDWRGYTLIHNNESEALVWLNKAAQQDHPSALWALGMLYRSGAGVLQDYDMAKKLFRKSASLGSSEAMRALGDMLAIDINKSSNIQLAYMWYNLSAEKSTRDGYTNSAIISAALRDKISLALEQDKLMSAQRLSNQCLASGYRDCGE